MEGIKTALDIFKLISVENMTRGSIKIKEDTTAGGTLDFSKSGYKYTIKGEFDSLGKCELLHVDRACYDEVCSALISLSNPYDTGSRTFNGKAKLLLVFEIDTEDMGMSYYVSAKVKIDDDYDFSNGSIKVEVYGNSTDLSGSIISSISSYRDNLGHVHYAIKSEASDDFAASSMMESFEFKQNDADFVQIHLLGFVENLLNCRKIDICDIINENHIDKDTSPIEYYNALSNHIYKGSNGTIDFIFLVAGEEELSLDDEEFSRVFHAVCRRIQDANRDAKVSNGINSGVFFLCQ